MDVKVLIVWLAGMLAVSLFTGLTVEAIKKLLKDFNKKIPNNILASVVSIILALVISLAYSVIAKVPMDGVYWIAVGFLMFCSWLCSMVGYDKVRQSIEQIIGALKGGKA